MPRSTGSSWQFASSPGFEAVLCLLWSWPRHMEAGRGSVWPHRCTDKPHFASLASLIFLLWSWTRAAVKYLPCRGRRKAEPSSRGSTKQLGLCFTGRGGRTASLFTLFFFPYLLPSAWGMYLGLLKNGPRFCNLIKGFFGFLSELPSGGIWQCPIIIWWSQRDLCFYLSI